MENIFVCYQCRECESQCPLAFWFDVPPPRLLQNLQSGETDTVLNCRTPWLCASCETCATQCPRRLDLAKVMTALTTAVRAEGIQPRVSDVPRVFLPGVDVRQRATELGLMPSKDNRAARVGFEAHWYWFRLRKRTRALLQQRIQLSGTTRQAPTLGELLTSIAFVVVALPMALGWAAGVAISSLRQRAG